MCKILILGIGNTLRSDDGVGCRLADELSRELQSEDVQIIATHQLMPETSEAVSRAERVLFIDATSCGEPGTLELKQIAPGCSSRRTHDLRPPELLQLAQDLYGHYPSAWQLTIAGESFNAGDRLSAKVAAALPSAKAHVANFINKAPE